MTPDTPAAERVSECANPECPWCEVVPHTHPIEDSVIDELVAYLKTPGVGALWGPSRFAEAAFVIEELRQTRRSPTAPGGTGAPNVPSGLVAGAPNDYAALTYARGRAAQAWCTAKNSGKEMDSDLAEAFAHILVEECRASPPSPAQPETGGVRVKPLEWHDGQHTGTAVTLLGVYTVSIWDTSRDVWKWRLDDENWQVGNNKLTRNDAKAAVFEHYSQYIRSALTDGGSA